MVTRLTCADQRAFRRLFTSVADVDTEADWVGVAGGGDEFFGVVGAIRLECGEPAAKARELICRRMLITVSASLTIKPRSVARGANRDKPNMAQWKAVRKRI